MPAPITHPATRHLDTAAAAAAAAAAAKATPAPSFKIDSLADIGTALDAMTATATERFTDLGARLLDVEQKGARKGSRGGAAGAIGDDGEKSLGELVEDGFADNFDLFKKTKSISFVVETKTITSPAVGAHGSQAVPTGPGATGALLYDLITPGDLAGLATLSYPRRTGIVGAAGVQLNEGDVKANTEPVFAAIAQNAMTIAGFANVSEQALGTAGQLQRAVNSHLIRSIRLAADAVLIGGTLAPSWPFVGYSALASAFAGPATFVATADAVLAGALRMRLNGFSPSIVVLSEDEFLHVMLAKSSTGEYLLDNYLADLSFALGGMRVALSEGIPSGKAMLVDTAYVGFLASGAVRVSLGLVGDQFIRNMVTVKAECEILPYMTDYEALMMVTPAAS